MCQTQKESTLLTMAHHNRLSSFMSLDYGLHRVEDATVSQLVLLVSVLGREGYAIPEFLFKNDVMVGLCMTGTAKISHYIE